MTRLYNPKKGDMYRILLVNDKEMEGQFHSANLGKDRLTFYNTKQLDTGDGYVNSGYTHFYSSEVLHIEKINESKIKDSEKTSKQCLMLNPQEILHLEKVSNSYVFLNNVDKEFYEALHDLKRETYIALSITGVSCSGANKMPFMVLSTETLIYVMHIDKMKPCPFDAGLRHLLESEYPKKIIHDCRNVAEELNYMYNVKLNSVYDTQAADLVLTKNKTGETPQVVKSLQECLQEYLGLSDVSSEDEPYLNKNEPVSIEMKNCLVKNITYLHKLSEAMSSQLNLPLERAFHCYLLSGQSRDRRHSYKRHKETGPPNQFEDAIKY